VDAAADTAAELRRRGRFSGDRRVGGRARGEGREAASGRKGGLSAGLVGGRGISEGGGGGGAHGAGSRSREVLERFGEGEVEERVANLVAACSASASG